MTSVFVSGANGFVASHLIAELIAKGYSVIGSVRSVEKGEQVKKVFPKNFKYAVIPDVSKKDAYDEALKSLPDLEGFFSVLSPVNALTDYEKDTIVPAIENVQNLLHSLKSNAPKLKRFVHTSSVVATANFSKPTEIVEISADTWNDQARDTCANPHEAYGVSKALSEKAIWEFFEKEKPSFTFNIVNPCLVLGPEYVKSKEAKSFSSLSEFGNLLKLKKGDTVPPKAFPIIDVRDVAKVHVQVFESKASSKRHLIANTAWSSVKFISFFGSKYPQLNLPEVDPNADKMILLHFPKVTFTDTGIKYIDIEKTFLDSYSDYIKEELLALKYKLRYMPSLFNACFDM